MADTMPSLLLDGEKPRLIDEWQEAPVLWDAVRFDVDQSGLWGQYILTGSATPRDDKKPMHTGTGRFTRLWMPSLRSKTAMRTSEKRQFVDPSIAAAAVRADANSILNDFEYFGQLFESLAARDFRVYTQNIGGEIFHYRDKDGLEIDLVIRLYDGRWAGVEVKLGSREIEYGANHLIAFRDKIDTEKVGDPAFLMVATGGEFAYRRKDGVFVIPLACLKD